MQNLLVVLAQSDGGNDWLKLAIIPIVAGVVGWGTNWLAVKMTFYPLKFIGIPPYLGWQGIIPSRARKMASISTDSSITKVGTLQEVMEQMEPKVIAAHLLHSTAPRVPELVDTIASEKYPDVWNNTPNVVKQAVYERSLELMPKAMDSLVADLTEHIDSILDMRLMVIDQLSSDPKLLVRMFLEAGKKEFTFLINSGLLFGGLLGIPQLIAQVAIPGPWVLPIAGAIVGYITNWLALKMIFEPAEEKKIGPFRLQGMMLKRQDEIADYFAATTSRELLTIKQFTERMLNGPKSDRAHALLRRNLAESVDEALGLIKPAAMIAAGGEISDIKTRLYEQAIQLVDIPFEDEAFVESRAKLVEAEMAAKLKAMTPEEFTGLLRPTVEEDEWKLIAVGAVLGGLAGLAQSVLVFAQ